MSEDGGASLAALTTPATPATPATLTTTRRLLDDMLRLQEAHNREVAADWRERGFPYYRAVWVECAELLDHYGWKWWKHQTPDVDQVHLELVDIWHFGLSMLMLEDPDLDALARTFADGLGVPRRAEDFRSDVEALASHALAHGRFSLPAFVDCLNAAGLDMHGLYGAYVGKNVLNNFRQRNGYADGSYRKTWAGREDNEHLMELVGDLDVSAGDFAERLAERLALRYRETAAG